MSKLCKEAIIQSNSFNNFVGYTGNKGKVIRRLPTLNHPYDYEVEFSNGITDYFMEDELKFV